MSKALYDQLETAIAEMDLLCSSVNDFVEERMKKLTNNTPNGKNRRVSLKSNLTKQQANVVCTSLLNKCSKV